MQTSLLSLAIALILALLAALLGPFFVDWSQYRPAFEAQASRFLGVPVQVKGPIDVRLLPTPSLRLNDIAIGAESARRPLRADALGVEFALSGFLRGQLRATELRLSGPDIDVHIDGDGRLDMINPAQGLNLDDVSIERLRIEDAKLELTDTASGRRWQLDRLRFEGEVRSLGQGVFRGDGAAVFDGDLYKYRISTAPGENGDARIKFVVEPSHLPLLIESEGVLSFADATPRFEGQATMARLAAAILADGKASMAAPWRIVMRMTATPASALFEQLEFQYGPEERPVKLGGAAEVTFGASPRAEAVLTARQVDIDRAFAAQDQLQRKPIDDLQALTGILGRLWQPALPVRIGFGIDSMVMGGATLQSLRGDLVADADGWMLTGVELRAPGFTQLRLDGRLGVAEDKPSFSGALDIQAADPRAFHAWLAGRTEVASGPAIAMQLRGDVTIAPGRIEIDRMVFDADRKILQGRLLYLHDAVAGKTRLETDLKAEDADFDSVMMLAAMLENGAFARPDEIALALDLARARFAGLDATQAQIRLGIDADGIRIERLNIADFGGMRISGDGAIDLASSAPQGNIALALDAPDLSAAIVLAEKFAPQSAELLRALSGRAGAVSLRAGLELLSFDVQSGKGEARFDAEGALGAVKVALKGDLASARNDQSEEQSWFDRLRAERLRLDAIAESENAAALLKLLGFDPFVAAEPVPGRLTLSAQGPLQSGLQIKGEMKAGRLNAVAEGQATLLGERSGSFDLAVTAADIAPLLQQKDAMPLSLKARALLSDKTLKLEDLSGRLADWAMSGRLAVNFASPLGIEGAVEADSLNLPLLLAKVSGLPANHDLLSEELFGRGLYPPLQGRIDIRAKQAALGGTLAAHNMQGRLRFAPEEVGLEVAQSEFAKGALSGEVVLRRAQDGTAANLRVLLKDADAALLAPGNPPQWSGQLTLNAESEGIGRSPKALVNSLHGFGMVSVKDARINGLDPKAFAAAIQAVDQGLPLDAKRVQEVAVKALDGGALSIKAAEAPFTMTAGQLRLDTLLVQADGADVRVSGLVDLREQKLDSRILLTGNQVENAAGRPELSIHLKGSPSAPKRSVDVATLSGWLALRAVDQQAKKLESIEQGRAAVPASAKPAANPIAEPVPVPVAPAPVAPAPDAPRKRPAGASKPAAKPLPPPINLRP